MELTAVIFTFHRGALVGALLMALAAALVTFAFIRKRPRAVTLSLGMGLAWFVISLFAIRTTLGIGVSSVEVVSYERSAD